MSAFQAVLLISFFTIVTANIFTSSHKLHKLALNEDKVLATLKDHIEQQHDRVQTLSNHYMKLRKELRHRQFMEIQDNLDHPNGIYHVIKRFARHYIEALGKPLDPLQPLLNQRPDHIQLANYTDWMGALRALLRLQDVYNLTTSDMIKGDYNGYLGPSLDFEDTYLVGWVAFTDRQINSSSEWLQKALELRREDPVGQTNLSLFPSETKIQTLLGRTFVWLNKTEEAQELLTSVKTNDPNISEVADLEYELEKPPDVELEPGLNYLTTGSRLCRYTEPFHIENPDYKAMKCRYKPGLLPYYVFREEILSISPYVSLFYNVVTEEERVFVKEKVYDRLSRGEVVDEVEGNQSNGGYSDGRTSDVAWLCDSEDSRIASLSQRIGLITGLSVEQRPWSLCRSGELFQVVNYGIGGHYDSHVDPIIEGQVAMRMATFLIYLNDVIAGGNTVFTNAGISVAPNKDAALFWYNFSPVFDDIDLMTEHAGCPVLIGEKWIANKWMHRFGNDYFRPCGLTPYVTQSEIESIMEHQRRKLYQKS